MGGNPVLDLIAYHDPGLHAAIRVWHYAAPGIVVVLAGSVCLSVWRVWLQPFARGGGRGRLPAWPVVARRRRTLARDRRAAPSDRAARERAPLLARHSREGTLHRRPHRRGRRHRQDHGLHVSVRPPASHLAGGRSRPQGGRARARGQGRLLPSGARHPRRRRARRRLPRDRARRLLAVEPARRSAARFLLARLRCRLPHQPALRQEPRTVLAASLYESRALDHRTVPALAGGLGHPPGHLPLHGGCGTVRPQDRRGAGAGGPALSGAGRHCQQGCCRARRAPRGLGLGAGARHGEGGLPARPRTPGPAQGTQGRVRDGGDRGRSGERVPRAGRGHRAVVPARLDGARCQAPHLDRRGHQCLPLALRPAAGRRRVLPATTKRGRVAVRSLIGTHG